MSTAFIVTARSAEDWRRAGSAPPPTVAWLRCIGCDQDVTISADAARKLAQAMAEGASPAGALCTPCLQIYIADSRSNGQVAGITTSEAGRDLLARSSVARAVMEALELKKEE